MNRDIRDPRLLGEKLLMFSSAGYIGAGYTTKTLSETYDFLENNLKEIPNYSGELLGFYTAKEYREELEAREDRYAKSTLKAIKEGTKLDSEIV